MRLFLAQLYLSGVGGVENSNSKQSIIVAKSWRSRACWTALELHAQTDTLKREDTWLTQRDIDCQPLFALFVHVCDMNQNILAPLGQAIIQRY